MAVITVKTTCHSEKQEETLNSFPFALLSCLGQALSYTTMTSRCNISLQSRTTQLEANYKTMSELRELEVIPVLTGAVH